MAFAVLRAVFRDAGRAVFRETDVFLALAALADFRFPGRGGLLAFFRRALPWGVLAPAVFRLAPPLRAVARAPAPALRLEGVFFWPRFLPLVFALFVVLAIHASGEGRPSGLRYRFLD
jgi:hypothetical protein